MKNTKIFGRASHPELTALMCKVLGVAPAPIMLCSNSLVTRSTWLGLGEQSVQFTTPPVYLPLCYHSDRPHAFHRWRRPHLKIQLYVMKDLHTSQMHKPVDNLYTKPRIAMLMVLNVPGWETGVVVCKNAGGAKWWWVPSTLTLR
ncbi:hypothetical protein BC938DRAFT_481234 [Jimgerdemannia flammicorona]|uniref:Uncharacterized protein n=1 Tax=Jimgerdemannia flammicorona TaxID=994334 RepID=A0A433QGS1_9FUNG|nr:hypothetical protein BC938DRAFT_481234 [Jimgerdemannia flammicorona]